MRTVVVIGLVAACGGGAKQMSGAPSNEASTVEVAPCPTEAELVALATELWAPSRDPENVWCVALRVQGEPRWWISGYASTDEPEAYGSSPHDALVQPPGTAIWKDAHTFDEMYPEATDPLAIDLDGDGTDEIVYESRYGEGGGSSTEVVVIGVAGARSVSASAGLGFSYMEDGCMSSWTIEHGIIAISGEGECATFSGRFRWNGTELITE